MSPSDPPSNGRQNGSTVTPLELRVHGVGNPPDNTILPPPGAAQLPTEVRIFRWGDLISDNWWLPFRRRCALPDVRVHDLRHSFASIGIMNGVSLARVGKLLGHALPETTARYAHLADTAIADAASRVSGSSSGDFAGRNPANMSADGATGGATASRGSRVMPTPAATIWRSVSRLVARNPDFSSAPDRRGSGTRGCTRRNGNGGDAGTPRPARGPDPQRDGPHADGAQSPRRARPSRTAAAAPAARRGRSDRRPATP